MLSDFTSDLTAFHFRIIRLNHQFTVTSDTHVLPVGILLPHPVVLVVHPLVAKLTVRLQGGLVLVAHVDHAHAPAGRQGEETAAFSSPSVTTAGNWVAPPVEHTSGSTQVHACVRIAEHWPALNRNVEN